MRRLMPLLLFGIAGSACAPAFATEPATTATPAGGNVTASVRAQVIDGIIAQLRDNYVFPDKAAVAEKLLRAAQKRGDYAKIGDGDALAERVTADLYAATHDKHLGVSYSADPLPPLGEAKGKDPSAMRDWRNSAALKNFAIPKVEVLPGNVGYIKMTNFLPAEFAADTFAAAMKFVGNSDALILDMRDNWGGSPDMVDFVLSYFVEPGTHLNDFYVRVDNSTRQMWSLPAVPGGFYPSDHPVYVLTNKVTISAAEEVAYDLKHLKRATVVGETTAGGANPGGSVALNEHFAVFVPVGRAINAVTKTNWEGVGVEPDVVTSGPRALDTAYTLALQKLRSEVQDSERRKGVDEAITAHHSSQ